jgi:hypothetical protein
MAKMSVLQDWVLELTLMQQGVLVAGVRGPDGIEKNHISKLLIRWLRRCILHMAFESKIAGTPVAFTNPRDLGGGSFTGPSIVDHSRSWQDAMLPVVNEYFHHLDEIPHHFHLHFLHAAEILGYKHPDPVIKEWWRWLYFRLVNDLHLNPETEQRMDLRLGDSLEKWREAEEVTAKGPKDL